MLENKVMDSLDVAVQDIFDGAIIMIGGFADVQATPTYLIKALAKHGAKNLTLVCNNTGMGKEVMKVYQKKGIVSVVPPWNDDPSILVENGQVRHAIASFPCSQLALTPFEKALNNGEVTLELVPQGTLAERIRAGKAGIGAFYTPTGVGTFIGEGKETRIINGKKHLLEYAIKGDFALVRARKADRFGNLIYRGTMRTFNMTMAGASKITIAEVDEIVEVGELSPELIDTPGIYVDRVVTRPREAWVQEVLKW